LHQKLQVVELTEHLLKSKMRILLILFFAAFMYACSSVKVAQKNCNENPFEQLDSLTRASQKLNYSISINSNWIKSKTSNGDWYYIKDGYDSVLQFDISKLNLYISMDKIDTACKQNTYTTEDYLNYFIDYRKRWFDNDFKFTLLKSKHKLYNEIYIVNYVVDYPNLKKTKRSVFIFFDNNVGYRIEYVAKEENYQTYLQEVEKIVNSFRILSD